MWPFVESTIPILFVEIKLFEIVVLFPNTTIPSSPTTKIRFPSSIQLFEVARGMPVGNTVIPWAYLEIWISLLRQVTLSLEIWIPARRLSNSI